MASTGRLAASPLLLIGFAEQGFYCDVLHRLEDEHGWQTVTCSHAQSSGLSRPVDIDAAHLHRAEDVPLAFGSRPPEPLDPILIAFFARGRILFQRTIDRVFLRPISERRVERYFNVLVGHWIAYLRELQPAAILFTSTPHFPWDIVAFFAAKYLNIPTRYVRITALDDVVLVSHDISPLDPCTLRYEPTSEFLVADPVLPTIPSTILQSSRRMNARFLSNRAGSFPRAVVQILKMLLTATLQPSARRALDWHYFRAGPLTTAGLLLAQETRVRSLQREMERQVCSGRRPRPCAYFALHSQPERSTDPEADLFTDQFAALELLRRALPETTTICVKEHPRQFSKTPADLRQRNYRYRHYYRDLASMTGIVLVPPDLPSEVLIAESNLVASSTGTVLWEAALQGVPSVSFAPTWHSACTSTPNLSSLPELEDGLPRLLQKGHQEVLRDVRAFLRQNRDQLVLSSFNTEQASRSEVPYATLVANMAQALSSSIGVPGHGRRDCGSRQSP